MAYPRAYSDYYLHAKKGSTTEKYPLWDYNDLNKKITPSGWIRFKTESNLHGYRLVPTNHPKAGKLLRVKKGSNTWAVATGYIDYVMTAATIASGYAKAVKQSNGTYDYYYEKTWTVPNGVNGVYCCCGNDLYYSFVETATSVSAGKVFKIQVIGKGVASTTTAENAKKKLYGTSLYLNVFYNDTKIISNYHMRYSEDKGKTYKECTWDVNFRY